MKNLLFAGIILVCSTVFSQDFTIGDYQVTYQDEDVKVSLAEGTYSEESRNLSHSRYFIQYENLTDKDIEITLQKELHYGENCYGCESNEESYKTVELSPNATLSFDENNKDKRFYFFVKDNNGLIKSQLTDFTIKIVKIKQL